MKQKIREYITELENNNYSRNTITCYKNFLDRIDFKKSAQKIKEDIVKDQNEKSPATIEFRKRVIIGFLKWVVDKRWEEVSLLKTPKQQKRFFNIVSDEQMNLIWEHDSSENLAIAFRNKLLYLALFNTGLRVSELLNIKLYDVDQDNSSIQIWGKGNKRRVIYINSSLLSLILSMENERYLFETISHEKMSYKTVYSIFQNIKKELYLPKDITLHSFRRTFCTNLINNGMNIKIVSELMGHSSISTTSNYISITSDEVRDNFIQFSNNVVGL